MPAYDPWRTGQRRRQVLGGAAAGSATLLVAGSGLAMPQPPLPKRSLRFLNLHTGERLAACYLRRGRYRHDALAEIDYILRDWRKDAVTAIDRGLFDLLFHLDQRLGSTGAPFHVISGYRTAETNAMLRSTSTGVAKRSYHVKAMAIDIARPDVPLHGLYREALAMRAGGVGYYPESGFIHVDVGPVRHW
jgi:uncharacterized protein YcbK (DUF882 family)